MLPVQLLLLNLLFYGQNLPEKKNTLEDYLWFMYIYIYIYIYIWWNTVSAVT